MDLSPEFKIIVHRVSAHIETKYHSSVESEVWTNESIQYGNCAQLPYALNILDNLSDKHKWRIIVYFGTDSPLNGKVTDLLSRKYTSYQFTFWSMKNQKDAFNYRDDEYLVVYIGFDFNPNPIDLTNTYEMPQHIIGNDQNLVHLISKTSIIATQCWNSNEVHNRNILCVGAIMWAYPHLIDYGSDIFENYYPHDFDVCQTYLIPWANQPFDGAAGFLWKYKDLIPTDDEFREMTGLEYFPYSFNITPGPYKLRDIRIHVYKYYNFDRHKKYIDLPFKNIIEEIMTEQ